MVYVFFIILTLGLVSKESSHKLLLKKIRESKKTREDEGGIDFIIWSRLLQTGGQIIENSAFWKGRRITRL